MEGVWKEGKLKTGQGSQRRMVGRGEGEKEAGKQEATVAAKVGKEEVWGKGYRGK